jgi:2-keto-4-pentenoate hydratase/2-oxohepta-3-ene-1,7-dioic acid hydratase in catechol pathway
VHTDRRNDHEVELAVVIGKAPTTDVASPEKK